MASSGPMVSLFVTVMALSVRVFADPSSTIAMTARPVVLVLMDNLFVDSFEANNLLSDLQDLTLREELQTVNAAALYSELQVRGGDVSAVVIPELEMGNLYSAAQPWQQEVLRRCVERGTKLLVLGANRFWRSFDVALMNGLFGWGLRHNDIFCETSGRAFLNRSAAAGTPFSALGITTLEHANAVYCLEGSSLPEGASVLYADAHRSVWAFMHVFGEGLVLFLGHDWFGPSQQWRRLLQAAMVVKTMPSPGTTTALTMSELPVATEFPFSTELPGALNTTLTSTTGTRPAFTQTTQTTTTTFRNPGCYPDRMHCAIPGEFAYQEYRVNGSANVPACFGQGRPQVFDFHVRDCFTTRYVSAMTLVRTATLVPYYREGQLIFYPVAPVVKCRCFSNIVAGAQSTVRTDELGHNELVLESDYRFEPTLTFVHSTTDHTDLAPGVAPSGDRFVMKVVDKDVHATIGLANITFSPTEGQNDPYRQEVRVNHCVRSDTRLGSGFQLHASGSNNVIVFSVERFKFAKYHVVVVMVDIIQCDEVPCGRCGVRRLTLEVGERFLARQLQEQSPGRHLEASVDPGNPRLVFPSQVDADSWRMERSLQVPSGTMLNFTLFGYASELGSSFEAQVERSLGHVFTSGVKATRLWLLPRQGEVAQGLPRHEAVMLELAILGTADEARASVEAHSEGQGLQLLAKAFAVDFRRDCGCSEGGMEEASLVFGPVVEMASALTVEPRMPASTTATELAERTTSRSTKPQTQQPTKTTETTKMSTNTATTTTSSFVIDPTAWAQLQEMKVQLPQRAFAGNATLLGWWQPSQTSELVKTMEASLASGFGSKAWVLRVFGAAGSGRRLVPWMATRCEFAVAGGGEAPMAPGDLQQRFQLEAKRFGLEGAGEATLTVPSRLSLLQQEQVTTTHVPEEVPIHVVAGGAGAAAAVVSALLLCCGLRRCRRWRARAGNGQDQGLVDNKVKVCSNESPRQESPRQESPRQESPAEEEQQKAVGLAAPQFDLPDSDSEVEQPRA